MGPRGASDSAIIAADSIAIALCAIAGGLVLEQHDIQCGALCEWIAVLGGKIHDYVRGILIGVD